MPETKKAPRSGGASEETGNTEHAQYTAWLREAHANVPMLYERTRVGLAALGRKPVLPLSHALELVRRRSSVGAEFARAVQPAWIFASYTVTAINRGPIFRTPSAPQAQRRLTQHPWRIVRAIHNGEPFSEQGDHDAEHFAHIREQTGEHVRDASFDRSEALVNQEVAGELPGLRASVKATRWIDGKAHEPWQGVAGHAFLPVDPRRQRTWGSARPDAIAPSRRPWRITALPAVRTLCATCPTYFWPASHQYRICPRCYSALMALAQSRIDAERVAGTTGAITLQGRGTYWETLRAALRPRYWLQITRPALRQPMRLPECA